MRMGVDLLSVPRFTRVAEHRRYRRLVFTEAELAQAGEIGAPRHAERLAGRFCAKEAVCKVLGRGFGQGLRWRDIEVTTDRWGAPTARLAGGAAQRAAEIGLYDLVITLTHQADLVVAVAAAQTRAHASAPRPAPAPRSAAAPHPDPGQHRGPAPHRGPAQNRGPA
ncbi:holo-ACP synthase [Streptomyces sp. DSM 44915]|uniref:Holo-[acyl-carrier-protein] synthase n=1 Tax=Streptomyces chisholmiae TaxID=3075540 RepID=A0ABU2JQW7_9ACTN|nr:holo-ACP synthase [Streptomyces sp. DSM 44915]MDT0267376.1 holo-ACP synthase [Streptomyces sp. DSM 44915]